MGRYLEGNSWPLWWFLSVVHLISLTQTVQHDPPPRGLQDMTLHRAEGEKLGMNVKGGLRGHPGNPLDKQDEGVFVSKINHGGAAKRDGRLKVGPLLSSAMQKSNSKAVDSVFKSTENSRGQSGPSGTSSINK